MQPGLIAGIGLTHLTVYDQRPAPDGLQCGCAHVHAVTDEAYAAGGHMLLQPWRLRIACGAPKRIARRLFTFSIAYLFALFAAYPAGKLLAAHFAL